MNKPRKPSFRGFHAEDRARQRAIYGLDAADVPVDAVVVHAEPAAQREDAEAEVDAMAFSGVPRIPGKHSTFPYLGD